MILLSVAHGFAPTQCDGFDRTSRSVSRRGYVDFPFRGDEPLAALRIVNGGIGAAGLEESDVLSEHP